MKFIIHAESRDLLQWEVEVEDGCDWQAALEEFDHGGSTCLGTIDFGYPEAVSVRRSDKPSEVIASRNDDGTWREEKQ